MFAIFRGFLKGILNAWKLVDKLVLTRVRISNTSVLNDLCGAPFEMRPCLGESLLGTCVTTDSESVETRDRNSGHVLNRSPTSCFQVQLIAESKLKSHQYVWIVSFNSYSHLKNIRDRTSNFWAGGPKNTCRHTKTNTCVHHKSTFTKTKVIGSIIRSWSRYIDIDDILSVNENHNGTSIASTEDPQPICFYYLSFFCSQGILIGQSICIEET